MTPLKECLCPLEIRPLALNRPSAFLKPRIQRLQPRPYRAARFVAAAAGRSDAG
jgi:hypothetical protein